MKIIISYRVDAEELAQQRKDPSSSRYPNENYYAYADIYSQKDKKNYIIFFNDLYQRINQK